MSISKKIALSTMIIGFITFLIAIITFDDYIAELWYIFNLKPNPKEQSLKADIEQKLNSKISISLKKGTTFKEALGVISGKIAENINLSSEVGELYADRKLDIQVSIDTSIINILSHIFHIINARDLKYEIEDGSIIIVFNQEKYYYYSKFYNLNDLINSEDSFSLNYGSTSVLKEIGENEINDNNSWIEVSHLYDLIIKLLKNKDGLLVGRVPKIQGTAIYVRTTFNNHIKIRKLLRKLRNEVKLR